MLRILLTALLAAWAVAGHAAELPCVLTGADYASLAQGKMHYTKNDIAGLSDSDKRELCRARLLVKLSTKKSAKEIARDCSGGDLPYHFSRYWTSAEYDRLKAAVAHILANAETSNDFATKCTASLGPTLR